MDDLLDFGAMMQPAAPVSNPPAQKEGSTPFGDIFSAPAKAPALKPVNLRDIMSKGRGVIFSNGEVTFEMLVQKQLEEGVIKVIIKETQGASGTVAVTGISRSESGKLNDVFRAHSSITFRILIKNFASPTHFARSV